MVHGENFSIRDRATGYTAGTSVLTLQVTFPFSPQTSGIANGSIYVGTTPTASTAVDTDYNVGNGAFLNAPSSAATAWMVTVNNLPLSVP